MKRLLLAGVAAFGLGGAAQAVEINGSFGGSFGVQVPAGNILLGVGTSLDLGDGFSTTTPTGQGDYSAVPFGTPLLSVTSPLVLSAGEAFAFTVQNVGAFSGTVQSAVLTSSATTSRTVRLYILGDFTPTGGGPLAGFDATESSVTLQFNQTGGPGEAISGAFTLASPPAPPPGVPAPMSLALFGLGLAGLGAVARRGAKAA